jgi:hypothetical protein
MPLLIDIQPGHLGLERDELRSTTRQHDVGPRFLEHGVHFAWRHIVDHVAIVAHDLLDLFFIFAGRFLHAGTDNFDAHFL